MNKRTWLVSLAVPLMVLVLLAACSRPAPTPAPAPSPKPAPTTAPAAAPTPSPKPPPSPAAAAKPAAKIPVLMAGPDPTWVSYMSAVAAADIANRNTNLNITVKSHAGTIPVINALIQRNVDLAFGPAEYSWAPAVYAEQEFKGKAPAKNLRAILIYLRMYSSVNVSTSSGIKTIPALKGKRIAWMTTTTMEMAQALLESYGLNPDKDIVKIPVPSFKESVQEMIMKRADAMWSAVEPPHMVELAEGVGKVFPLPWDADKLEWMRQNRLSAVRGAVVARIQPGYMAHLDIPPGGLLVGANVWTAVTRDDVPADVIYAFTKAWIANAEKFKTTHKQTAEFGPSVIQTPSEMPYHEGAIKALKEAGMWTAEMERVHQIRLKAAS